MYLTMIANLSDMVRHDQMEGKDWLVVPMIMLTEGVHSGSNGPLYYPEEELAKAPGVWNYKPVVVNHPSKDGKQISACNPVVLSTRKVGVIMNTKFEDGKLKAEAWLEEDRLKKIDNRIMESLENNSMVEVSTGLFAEFQNKEGTWNEEKYKIIARNYRPDHLAILPDLKGACSIEDGAGLLRLNSTIADVLVCNEMSHDNVRAMINSYLFEVKEAWAEDIYDAFFVYMDEGKFFKQTYKIVDNQLEITNETEEVVKVTEYRTTDGLFIGNEDIQNDKGDIVMEKNELIAALISNSQTKWIDEDKDVLGKFTKTQLEKMLPVENQVDDKDSTDGITTPPIADTVEKPDKVPAADMTGNVDSPKTVEQYIKDAPSGIQGPLTEMMANHAAAKKSMIEIILANENNTFTEDFLKTKDIKELKALCQLASNGLEQQPSHTIQRFDYSGMGAVGNKAGGETPEPLVAPTLNFSSVE